MDDTKETTPDAIENGVGVAGTPQTKVDMSVAVPQDIAAAYDSMPTQMTQEALEHVWVHTCNDVELAEQRGIRVFDYGKDKFFYDVYGTE